MGLRWSEETWRVFDIVNAKSIAEQREESDDYFAYWEER